MVSILPDSLKYDIYAVLKKNESIIDDIEIEVKVRDPKKDRNLNLLEEQLIKDGFDLEKTESVDYRNDNKRITYINGEYFETSKYNLINDKYFKAHDLKLTVSREENKKIDGDVNLKPFNYVRKKVRKSYIKNNFSIDITQVNDDKKELEIEVVNAKDFKFDKLNQLLEYIFSILFNISDKVIEDFTFAMGRKEEVLNKVYDLFSKARDLEYKDLTNDGILQPFTISLKADGDTRFLYFHPSGVFIINIQKDTIDKISSAVKDLNNSLFVGEIIPKNELKKAIKPTNLEFLFLPYDCLRFNNVDLKRHNYLIRFSKCQNIYDKVFGKILVNQKRVIQYENNVDSFNNTVIEMFKLMKKVIYDTDGVIFTPINSPYVTAGQRNYYKKDDRYLAKYLDVCKYKLPDDLTIDLLVKEDGVYTNKGKFRGTKKFPVQDYSFHINDDLIGKIIEFKPYQDEDGRIIYQPFRDRSSTKSYPNNANVVNILWGLRHEPIELATLEGRDNKLQWKYHNQIKRKIIENLNGFVIDIGSGKGGDLSKYLKNHKVKDGLFIEPNQEFIDEFIKRRSNMNLGNKTFEIIKGGGEETDKIINKIKENIIPKMLNKNENWQINMMISLSFFWKDKKMLDDLANTLNSIKDLYFENDFKGNVYFNFLTIEGSRLKKLFEDRGAVLKLNNVYLRKIDDNEVFVDIKDSKTVTEQTEYFVYLNQLFDKINFSLLKLNQADGLEKGDFILSDNERTYSSLFVFGQAKYIKKKKFDYNPLVVNENKGIKTKNGIKAVGDDELEKLPLEFEEKLGLDNLYRVATMKKEGSLKHSILKLLQESYRLGDIYDRKKMAKRSPYDSLDKLPIASKVISKNNLETINKDKDKYILLLENLNGEFEPIIQIKDDKITRVFK